MSSKDNTNRARLLEYQRLLAPVMGSRWVVLHYSGNTSFITNDLGLTPTTDLGLRQEGFAVPIGRQAVLGVFPHERRWIASYDDDGWRANIEHRTLDAAEVDTANAHLARSATEWIVGPDRELVERNRHFIGDKPSSALAVMETWPFDHETRVAHDLDWHRLISATAGDPAPADLPDLQLFEPDRVNPRWFPPLIVTVNMREFPTGLHRVGPCIRLDLNKPADYDTYFITDAEFR